MPKKPIKRQSNETQTANSLQEFVILGHLIKYNLYLLAKAVVFSAVSQKTDDNLVAASITNKIMDELDLDTKRRAENSSNLNQDQLQ